MKPMLAIVLAAAIGAAVAASQDAPPEPPQEPTQEALDARPATAAAEAWLETVDARRYGAAWDAAAPLLQGAIERTQWEVTLQDVRGPLGAAAARKLRSATYARSLPNAPAGEYVVIEYATHFQNRPLTVETVTPMKQPDGTWKVAGYFIR